MIGALPIIEKNYESVVYHRCARSPYFAILNTEIKNVEIIENPFHRDSSDTGRLVLERLISKYSVDTLISFELGINIQQAANKNELQIILIDSHNRKLQEIMDLLKL